MPMYNCSHLKFPQPIFFLSVYVHVAEFDWDQLHDESGVEDLPPQYQSQTSLDSVGVSDVYMCMSKLYSIHVHVYF